MTSTDLGVTTDAASTAAAAAAAAAGSAQTDLLFNANPVMTPENPSNVLARLSTLSNRFS